jgi:hypothetical protein
MVQGLAKVGPGCDRKCFRVGGLDRPQQATRRRSPSSVIVGYLQSRYHHVQPK